MNEDLNIVISAIDETEAAFSAVSSSMDSLGLASEEMAVTFNESVAQLNEGMAMIDESASVMATEFDTAIAEMKVASESGAVAIEESAAAEAETFAASISSLKSTAIQAGIVAGIAFQALKSEIEDAAKSSLNWNETLIVLTQELKNIGSNIPVSQITDFAQSLSSTTLYSQQQILSAVALLTSHKELAGSYQMLTDLAADLATKIAGGGQGDLTGAMGILVKALNDPQTGIRNLQGAGLDFNKVMVDTVDRYSKLGSTAEASQIIIQALNDQIHGLAEASANASGTGFTKLINDISTMQKNIGTGLNPELDKLAAFLTPIVESINAWIVAHPKLTADILIGLTVLTALLVVIAGIALIITTVISSFIALGEIISAVAAAPVALLIAAGLAVVASWSYVAVKLGENWDFIWDKVKTVAGQILTFIEDWYNKIMTRINNILSAMKSIGSSIGGGISGAIGGVENFVTTHLASGGIVNSPTVALIGEAGPEAVIPLSMLGSGGGGGNLGGSPGGIVVNINGTVMSTSDQATLLGNMIAKQIAQQLKLQSWR